MKFRADLSHKLSNLLFTEARVLGQEGGHFLRVVWQDLLLHQILDTTSGLSEGEGGGREEEGGEGEVGEGGRERGR